MELERALLGTRAEYVILVSSNCLIKQCSYELAQPVADLFSFSLLSSSLPDTWTKALVTPIPKVLIPVSLTDYRPISVTPILSRLLEKIIVKNFIYPYVLPLLSDQ